MKRILFIDDDEILLETVKLVFTDLNYEVITCTNGKDAIQIAGNSDFDLIITDYLMPEMNGIEVITKLKEMGITTRIYILTGHIDEDNFITNANKAGVSGIMEKPFEISKIITLLGYS